MNEHFIKLFFSFRLGIGSHGASAMERMWGFGKYLAFVDKDGVHHNCVENVIELVQSMALNI